MKPPKDALLLIDGHAVLYRSFHALPPLHTKEAIPTNAIYGFITTLLKAFDDTKPKYCAVAFDLAGPTFRHESFDGYKASRKPTPDDLATQIPYAYQVVEAMNIPIFTSKGYEADDVIGTLSKQAKSQGVPVIIVTGDRDAFQLVDDSTFVYIMRRSMTDIALYDAEGVVARMGVTPRQIPDLKALAGDSSDEIPGIAGVGEKTALTILSQAPSITSLYEKLKKNDELPGITPRIRQKLIEGEDIARQSRELATIDRDVPITLDIAACVIHDYDPNKVATVFQKLEFFSLLKRLPQASQVATLHEEPQERAWKYKQITTENDLRQIVADYTQSPFLAVDTETETLDGPIIGISLAASEKLGYYIPLISEHGALLSKEAIVEILKPLLENTAVRKVGHNIKYDMHALHQLGITLQPIAFDTMVAAYILHAHMRTFDFDSVCQREFGYTTIPLSAIVAKAPRKDFSMLVANPEKLAEYAAEDAIYTYRLFEHFSHKLESEGKLKEIAQNIDFLLIPVLFEMEQHGICVDKDRLRQLETEIEREITSVKAEIESYTTTPININSPTQLQKLLFEDLKLTNQGMKTIQSGISTAAAELEKLSGEHPVIDQILRYRELTKLQNTYIKTLPLLLKDDGRLHTQFSQTTAATGRLASSEPNLQNIPIRTEQGTRIRTAFIPPSHNKFVSLDYSQFELRIIAHLSGDQQLIKVFQEARDIHDEVSTKLSIDRRAAKAINFGIIYGLSAYGLSRSLKIEPKVAGAYIDAYFTTYPGLKTYLDTTKQEAREKGYVETLFGRRRVLPEIHAANANIRAQAERMAINAPAQGTEADLMKLAMIQVHNWLEATYKDNAVRPYLVLQVHDSLLLEVPNELVDATAKKVKEIMESVDSLVVPLTVDVSVGDNWGDMNKLTL